MEYKLFSYAGNKDREIKQFMEIIVEIIEKKKIKTIVEPFGGSFSLIRHLIKTHPNLKYHVNDNNKRIISLYNKMKNEKDNTKIIKKIKKLEKEIDSPEKMKKIKDSEKDEHFLFGNIKYQIRPFIYPTKKTVNINYKRLEAFSIFKDVNFTYKDFKEIYDQYKDDSTALLFLDPPYFLSCNDYYQTKLNNDFFEKSMNTYKFTSFLVINNNLLVDYFLTEKCNFEKKLIYDVVYCQTHRKDKHCVYIK